MIHKSFNWLSTLKVNILRVDAELLGWIN